MPARIDGSPRPGRRPLSGARAVPALAVALAHLAIPARGQQEPADAGPVRVAEQVTVTATRGDARVGDTPASVATLPRAALDATAAPAVDDALRQVAGFSLFRRAGSRAANPTAQGVSLRGLGASGASRALVLADGLPLNDPFGGWVYWARVPRLSLERVEVLRGGASDLYGSGALGGVVQLVTRAPASGRGLEGEASAGGFLDARRFSHRARHPWRVVLPGLGPGLPDRRLRAGRAGEPGGGGHRGRLAPRGARRHGRAAGARRRARLPARHGLRGGPRERDAPAGERHPERPRGARRRLGRARARPGAGPPVGTDAGLPPGLQRRLRRPLARGPHADAARARLGPRDLGPVGAPPGVAPPGPGRGRGAPRPGHDGRDRVRARVADHRDRGGGHGDERRRLSPGPRPGPPAAPPHGRPAPRLVGPPRRERRHDPARDLRLLDHGVRRPAGDRPEPAPRARLPGLADALAPRLGLRSLPRPDPERALPLVPRRRHADPREPRPRGGAAPGRRGGSARDAGPRLPAAHRLRRRGGRRGGERDGGLRPRPRHPPAPQRRTRPLARARGGGGVAGRRPWRPHRRLRPHRRPRAELPGGPRARGPAAAPGPAPPGDVPGALRRPGEGRGEPERVALEARPAGAVDERGLGGRPQPARARPGPPGRPPRRTEGREKASRSSPRRRTSSTPRSWWPAPRCRAWARRASCARGCGCGPSELSGRRAALEVAWRVQVPEDHVRVPVPEASSSAAGRRTRTSGQKAVILSSPAAIRRRIGARQAGP